jgi:hypothetical protein
MSEGLNAETDGMSDVERLTAQLERVRAEFAQQRSLLSQKDDEIARLARQLGEETKLAKQRDENARIVRQIAEDQADLARAKTELAARQRELHKQELNAEAGFAKQNDEATRALSANIDSLKRQIKELEATLRAARREAEKREGELSREARAALTAELAKRRAEADAELGALNQAAAATHQRLAEVLVASQEEFGATAKSLRLQWTDAMEAGRRELAGLQKELQEANYRNLAEEQNRAIREEARLREALFPLREAYEKASSELFLLREEKGRLIDGMREMQKRFDESRRVWDVLGDPARLLAEKNQLEATIEQLRTEVAGRASLQETAQFRTMAHDHAKLSVLAKTLEAENHQLRQAIEYQRIIDGEYETIQTANEGLRARIQVLKQIYDDLVADYQKLTDRVAEKAKETKRVEPGSPEYQRRMGNISLKGKKTRDPGSAPATEIAWLEGILKQMQGSGIRYPMRMLKSFHTCLKIAEWAPLTVLAGVSGTGKSELPKLYSRFGGMHYELVSVQQGWQSPQDLFGFYNYMDNRFAAQPLLQAMARCQQPLEDGGYGSQMLLVLLDEMNLAEVERYLSDLLSKWEQRRGEDKAKLEIDLGPDCDRFPIKLGLNMLFAGTINEDDTTYALSDKVIDRGNLLYFPRPQELFPRTDLTLKKPAAPLAFDHWKDWQELPPDPENEPELYKAIERCRQSMGEINRHFAKVGRAIGHRVWQATELYICNHPDVRVSEPADLKKNVRLAFEDQVVQRVMPKLRGLVNEGAGPVLACLTGIGQEIEENAPGLVTDFRAAVAASDRGFAWRQSDYLEANE